MQQSTSASVVDARERRSERFNRRFSWGGEANRNPKAFLLMLFGTGNRLDAAFS
jgi:hypothetical protein